MVWRKKGNGGGRVEGGGGGGAPAKGYIAGAFCAPERGANWDSEIYHLLVRLGLARTSASLLRPCL